MHEVMLPPYRLKVFPCEDGNWRHDTVFIYNNTKVIAEKEVNALMQYLFDEGFIKDRRTKYYIAERDSD
tara:strand:- start:356 stop:562 length:207 start_codon:yes stop_codon:yes gene_type:complete